MKMLNQKARSNCTTPLLKATFLACQTNFIVLFSMKMLNQKVAPHFTTSLLKARLLA